MFNMDIIWLGMIDSGNTIGKCSQVLGSLT